LRPQLDGVDTIAGTLKNVVSWSADASPPRDPEDDDEEDEDDDDDSDEEEEPATIREPDE
jgi:hypothetical protein